MDGDATVKTPVSFWKSGFFVEKIAVLLWALPRLFQRRSWNSRGRAFRYIPVRQLTNGGCRYYP